MAEFASAIVGLIVFGVQVGTKIQSCLQTWKDAPSDLHELFEDVAQFSATLTKLQDADESGCFDQPEFKAACDRGYAVLREVNGLVSQLCTPGQGDAQSKVKKPKWLVYQKRVKKLRERLQQQRTWIMTTILSRSLPVTLGVGRNIQSLESKIDALSSRVQHFDAGMRSNSAGFVKIQEGTCDQILDDSEKGSAQLEERAGTTLQHSPSHSRGESTATLVSVSANGPLTRDLRFTGLSAPKTRKRQKPLSCLEDCACDCHQRVKCCSPRYLSSYLGAASLRISNLFWCLPPIMRCSEQTCRRSESTDTQIRFTLPAWFTETVAALHINLTLKMVSVQICIESLCTIPYCSPIFKYIEVGDLSGIQTLLISQKSSIRDVDPYGLGLLYYAAYYCWRASGPDVALQLCKALLQMGVDAEQEDEIGNTPCDTMIDEALVSCAMQADPSTSAFDTIEEIAILFGMTQCSLLETYGKSRRFTPVHEALLGLDASQMTLDEYLDRHPDTAVDQPDASGRTPLAWAAEFGWPAAVKTLLRHGADPTQERPCRSGASPLLHVVVASPPCERFETDFIEVMRLLAGAGADFNGVDHDGWTPLHIAASWSLTSAIRLLSEVGGARLDWDAKTNDGESALDLAMLDGGHEDVVKLLTSRRADEAEDADETFFEAEDSL